MFLLEKLMIWIGRVALGRVARLLPVIPMIVLCASCSDFWVSNSSIATVTVSPSALILKAAAADGTGGDVSTLSASATTVGGTTTDETSAANWTSSAATVATASAGKITIVGPAADQTAVITATFGGQSATCQVLTYTGTAPTTLVVSFPTTVAANAISPGQTFKVFASASLSGNSNHDISSYVTWTSNNTAVATVDANGNVVVSSGATAGENFVITATATFASGTAPGQSAQFNLPII
jgi:hypothetical protein